MSSGWLDALLPGKTLPLDEPRLTDFEALNPLLGRTPDDSTERRIVCPARGFPAKRCRRTSSGWLGALLPGKTLPLDEPRLTGFETLNPLLERTPDDSTERRIVCPARGFPATRCRRTSSGWLVTFFPGEALPLDEPRLPGFETLNPLLGRAFSGDSTKRNALCRCSGARLPGELLPLDEPRLTGFETLNPLL